MSIALYTSREKFINLMEQSFSPWFSYQANKAKLTYTSVGREMDELVICARAALYITSKLQRGAFLLLYNRNNKRQKMILGAANLIPS